MRLFLVSMVVGLTLGGCSNTSKPADMREWRAEDHAQPAQVDPARVATEAPANQPADPARAALALWKVACAGCHGVDGRGAGPALPPGASVPNFVDSEWQTSRSDPQIADVIRNGRNLMPAFGKQVTEDGIGALVAHLRSLRP